MKWRLIALSAFSSIFVVVCAGLGFWQLGRHAEQQPLVVEYERRFAEPPAPFDEVARHFTDNRNARVILEGSYDFSNEIVLVNRTRRGAPGVHVITPLIRRGTDTAVLVNRGWVYSPDGSSILLDNWRAGANVPDQSTMRSDSVTLLGVALALSDTAGARALAKDSSGARARLMKLAYESVAGQLPYPIAPLYVQLLPLDTLIRPGVPTPLPPPKMSAGQHLSYALQWFSFAVIAIAGTAVVIRSTLRRPVGL